MKGYQVKSDVIIINRGLTVLDIFVKDFLEVLKKYSDYLINSLGSDTHVFKRGRRAVSSVYSTSKSP